MSAVVRVPTDESRATREIVDRVDALPTEQVLPEVVAIVVVHNGAVWLPECLDALADQTHRPLRTVIVDVASTDASRAVARGHERLASTTQVHLLELSEQVPFGAAVSAAVAHLGASASQTARWLWLVHDDSAPEPQALTRLLEATVHSPTVGVIGPKLVEWHDRRRLVAVGHRITRTGRPVRAPAVGERDQGQYDGRTDVIAVPTSGMLVRRDVFDEIGGFLAPFTQLGADLDFGWRAQLAGHRVVVVPGAVVRDATASWEGSRPGDVDLLTQQRRDRQASRQVALARCPAWLFPAYLVWIAVTSLLGAVVLLALKRPRHAWAELADLTAVFSLPLVLTARWRDRPTRAVRSKDLRGLFVSMGEASRHTWDQVQAALRPEDGHRESDVVAAALAEPGPVAEEAEVFTPTTSSVSRRVLGHPAVLATLVSVLVAVVVWRSVLLDGLDPNGAGVTSSELRPVTTGASGLWHDVRDAWRGAGPGSADSAGQYGFVLAAVSWLAERSSYIASGRAPAGVALAWLLFLAMPLSTLTAYSASAPLGARRWARALAALAWSSSVVLTAAVTNGRIGPVVLHILLPLVLGGVGRCLAGAGTTTAAFATALATAVAAVFVPLTLVFTVLSGVLLVLAGPGWARRWRGLVLVVAPTALIWPTVRDWLAEPGLLLTGAGAMQPAGEEVLAPWFAAVADPVALGLVSDGSWAWWTATPMALTALLAVVALTMRDGDRSMSVARWALSVLALIGLGLVAVGPRLQVGTLIDGEGRSVPAALWPGVGAAVALLACLGLMLTLTSAPARSPAVGDEPAWRRIISSGRRTAVVLGVMLVAGSALAASSVVGLGEQLAVARDSVPAAAAEQADGVLASRVLILRPAAGALDYELVGREPGAVVRTVNTSLPMTDPVVEAVVVELTTGPTESSDVSGRLAAAGVGFVSVVNPNVGGLGRSLDSIDGLTRLGTTAGQSLWRVEPRPAALEDADAVPAARAVIVDPEGAPIEIVPVTGAHAATQAQVPAGPAGREVVFAQPPQWVDHVVVEYDDRVLTAAPGRERPTYALPAEAGSLRVSVEPAVGGWLTVQGLLLAFVVFMAVPFGSRRSRRHA